VGLGEGREGVRELAALGVHLYPPIVLLRHAKESGLTPDQVTKIRQEMLGTQAKVIDLGAKVGHARIEATRLLAADKVDERAVGLQVDEAAKAKAEMHKLRIGMMLRVRALLTPEQRQKLDEHTPMREPPKRQGMGSDERPTSGALGEADDERVHDDDDDDDDDMEG
jgi:uncharacterized membrane protein